MDEKKDSSPQGEIVLIGKEAAFKPGFFDALKKFQYGETAEESNQGFEEILAISKQESLPEIYKRPMVLYIDDTIESKLAAKYLKEESFNFQIQFNFNKNLVLADVWQGLPILKDLTFGYKHCSLAEIKNVLRFVIFKKLGMDESYSHPKNLAFYTHWDYSAKPTKVTKIITCFNEQNEKIYEGDVNNSPFQFQKALEKHHFKDWHEVACWQIGDWRAIASNVDEKGRAMNLEKKLILFPDEIEALETEGVALKMDSRSMYNVTYEAYFKDRGMLYMLYANMFD